jgi:hypothetical protein
VDENYGYATSIIVSQMKLVAESHEYYFSATFQVCRSTELGTYDPTMLFSGVLGLSVKHFTVS